MAKQTLFSQFFVPVGYMDRDSSLWEIATDKGNYYDALNVTGVSLTGSSNRYVTNVQGNSLAFVLPTIAAQNKLYQILYTSTAHSQTWGVQFTNVNGSNFPTNTFTTITTGGTLSTDTNAIASAIYNILAAHGYSSNVYPNQTWNGSAFVTLVGSVMVQITQQTGFDYIITNYSTANNQAVITIAQESWDTSLAGLCIPTGSNADFGNLMMISSPVGSDPVNYTINGTGLTAPGTVTIAGDVHTKITAGMSVVISGVNGTTEANGTWIVTSSTYHSPNTTVTLYNTSFSNAYTSGGTLQTYSSGLINIDVHDWNQTANTWANTVLLQTKQINSRWNHPERRMLCDEANGVTNYYFTDNNDVPRIFSYQGAYLTNGAIIFYNSNGLYTYEGINLSMNLQLSNATAIISSASVVNSGGGVTAGNWRYAVTLEDSTGVTSLPSFLSAPVEVYNNDITVPENIRGDVAGSPTSKQVQITVIDIPIGVYTQINLIGVNYVQDTEVGYLIKTVNIPSGVSTMTITHTGNETYIDYDTSGLTANAVTYVKAGDLTIASNTLLMADLTSQQINDFTLWAQTFQHTIKKGTSQLTPQGDDIVGYTLGDYQNPSATFNYVGYMDNETYRFGAVVELLNGTRTPAFWVDDIRMDNFKFSGTPFNRANPNNNNRRVSSFSSYDLSPDSSTTILQNINAYVTYLTFSNINLNYLIAGQPIYGIAKRIHIFRVNNNDYGLNEVLGCGMINRHVYVSNIAVDNPFLLTNLAFTSILGANSLPSLTSNYASTTTMFGGIWSYSYGAWYPSPSFLYDAYSASFYCPDAIFNQAAIGYESGDTIYCYGQPQFKVTQPNTINETYENGNAIISATTLAYGAYLKMSGSTGITTWGNSGYLDNIATAVGGTQSVNLFSGIASWNPNSINGLSPAAIVSYDGQTPIITFIPPGNNIAYNTPPHYLICCNSSIKQNNPNMGNSSGNPTRGALDLGLYYIQYYRTKGSLTAYSTGQSKFGSISNGIYTPTGTYIDIANVSNLGSASTDVYGGDTFTQKTYLKIRYPDTNNMGGGLALCFFCQSYFNYDMRHVAASGLNYPTTGVTVNNYVQMDVTNPENFSYDAGYTPRNIENRIPAFNPSTPNVTDYSNRKIFSLVKPQGSSGNPYRQFPPLNFEDNAPTDGIIRAMFTVQGEIHTLQDYAFNRHFYNERGTFKSAESSGSTDVTLGSGAPFSKPYDSLSSIGTSNQFSVLFGSTPDGDDLVGWIDVNTKNVMLYSRGKLRSVNIERMMRTWFFSNLNLTGDIPVLGNSITGVFDDKRREFIWTVLNSYNAPQWNNTANYTAGQIVSNGTTFEGNPAVFSAKINNTGVTPPATQTVNAPITNTVLGTSGAVLAGTTDLSGSIPAGSVVQISGVVGTTEANGTWTVQSSVFAGASGTLITLEGANFTNPYVSGGTVSNTPITSNSAWQMLPAYYTIVYNTLVDGFTTFLSPLPYFYVPYLNTYLTAYPNTTYNGIYLSDFGNYCTWYPYNGTSQQVNGTLTWIVNENSRQDKRFAAFSINSLVNPYTINANTFKHTTYMGSADTTNYLDRWLCPVKNDTITSPDGTPSNNSSALFGQWMQAQLVFQYGVVQSLQGVENKYLLLSRLTIN